MSLTHGFPSILVTGFWIKSTRPCAPHKSNNVHRRWRNVSTTTSHAAITIKLYTFSFISIGNYKFVRIFWVRFVNVYHIIYHIERLWHYLCTIAFFVYKYCWYLHQFIKTTFARVCVWNENWLTSCLCRVWSARYILASALFFFLGPQFIFSFFGSAVKLRMWLRVSHL